MKLSPHFNKSEFEASATARSKGLDNTIPGNLMGNAIMMAEKMEEVRAALKNNPILVSSGYRGPSLNKAVGGSTTSAHCQALAVDFTCPKFGNTTQICKALIAAGITFDQLINEFQSWVHIGLKPDSENFRMQVLTASKVNGKTVYTKGL